MRWILAQPELTPHPPLNKYQPTPTLPISFDIQNPNLPIDNPPQIVPYLPLPTIPFKYLKSYFNFFLDENYFKI